MNSTLSKFLLTNEEGDAIMIDGRTRVYEATKPASAAMKAYYALARVHKHVTKEPLAQPIILHAITKNVEEMNLAPEIKAEYIEKVRQAKLGFSAIVYLRKPTENKVRTYFISYMPILKPNKHEVSKGIVKVAHAQIWKGRVPDDTVFAHKIY